MRTRLSWWLVFCLLAALALAFSACGGDDDSGGSGDRVTLKFLDGATESSREEATAQAVIDKFNDEHPDIQVKRETIAVGQQRAVLRSRLLSGSGPDVFTYDTGAGFGGVLAKAGLLAPLDDAYEKYDWKIFPWARAGATYNGKTYAVPDSIDEVGVFYNADLFSDLGVEPPQTLEELEHIADLVKEKDKIPFAFGDKDGWPGSHMLSMTVSNLLTREGLDEILYADGRWDDPKVVKGIDLFFRQFADRGYLPDGATGIGYEDSNALFYAGKAAMLPTGTWVVNDTSERAPFKAGFFPFPSIDGSAIAPPAGVGQGWFVSAKSRHKAAAEEFLSYMTSEETAQGRAERLNIIPAVPIDTSDLDVPELFKEVLAGIGKSAADPQAYGYNIDVLTPANFNDVMYSGLQEVLGGDRTPQAEADALQAAWEKAQKAGDVLEKP